MKQLDVTRLVQEERSNVAILSSGISDPENNCSRCAKRASERFIHAASLLPEGLFLGWRIQNDMEGNPLAVVFSSTGIHITQDDYTWFFDGCATVEGAPRETIEGLSDKGRRIYALRYEPRESEKTENPRHRSGYYYDDFDEPGPAAFCSDVFESINRLGATVEFIVSSEHKGKGLIVICLPDRMTLRLHTMLSLVFTDTAISEVEPDTFFDEVELLPPEILKDGMSRFLEVLVYMGNNEKSTLEDNEEDDASSAENQSEFVKTDEYTPGCTPIEELDLSVRSYNCLKRAGIDTAEELRAMTDDELFRVRNLGRKCISEIRQRLSETASLAAVVQRTAPSYRAMLEELIGLQNVKEQVKKIEAFARMQKDLSVTGKSAVPVVLNMEFTGNPGTAKTTVARIIAGIYSEIGLLSSNELVEVGRADLVARYEGQTADKVKTVFRKANGKLLFIDEAYSLVENHEGEFGDEAISTIVQEMENNRKDTIVIFAGYPDKMEEFFSRNPGLRSRVPFSIRFNDYSTEEMVQIAEMEAKKRGFTIESEAMKRVAVICAIASHDPEAGNGRFCRNLVEHAILSYASRIYGVEGQVTNQRFELLARDFSGLEMLQENKKTIPVGFSIG